MSSMFAVRIKAEAGQFGGFYVARNFLNIEINLTKDLHSARIWGTYHDAEQWLRRYRGVTNLNQSEVVKVLDMLRKP